ncbi:MAG: glutamate--tRNA ligase [Desulfobacterota bacterium]|nr:glutamate--tRNA ligase [Thermodesulfobacteriota bacterium]MDW8002061.1 glutamate--tRNA ligase [Deltaproteobacteria bacterium]
MVRVRFAPSPTGYLHVGNARTAILNFLFAKKNGGHFLLRIEDTDRARSDPHFESSILEDLLWLGVKWDEKIYRQSQRLHIYHEYAKTLIDKGYAYKCFCSKERLRKLKEECEKRKEPPRYDKRCKNLSDSERKRLESEGIPSVIRFSTPERTVEFLDSVFGRITFPKDYLDDFIIMKADGTPSYNFAAAVDDMLMGITHVIRGKDHIPNTPKQILIFEALGRPHPVYAHHSLLLGKDGKPLSKREGSNKIRTLREMGILPSAVFNYLTVLGRKTEKEIMDLPEMVESFSIESISRSDAVFDFDKLLWFNRNYIKKLPSDELTALLGLKDEEKEVIDALKENAETLNDLKESIRLFKEPMISEEGFEFLKTVETSEKIACALKDVLEAKEGFSFASIVERLKRLGVLRTKEEILALRVLLTGKKTGPPIDSILRFIPEETIKGRLKWLKA